MDRRERFLSKEVGDPTLRAGMSFKEFINEVRKIGGFTVKSLLDAIDYLVEMVKDNDLTIFFSFTANLIATGLRSLIAEFINKGFVDVIFTTGGAVDHDIARSLGGKYYIGDFDLDDRLLKELELYRLGNILIPYENYGPLIERFTWEILKEASGLKEGWGVRELLWFVGSKLDDRTSFMTTSFKRRVPIYSPGVVDSAFGTALLTFNEKVRIEGSGGLKLEPLKDLKELSDISFTSRKIGGIVVGGGISKHHLIWWSQFCGGLEYAIYITTAVEWDGSLSGARTREAISWRKVKPEAKRVTVYGDATVILPLLLGALYERCEEEGIKRENRRFGLGYP